MMGRSLRFSFVVPMSLCIGRSAWAAEATRFSRYLCLHVLHRLFALLVLGHLVGMAIVTFRAARTPTVKALALAAPLLAVVQITLGVLSITTFLDAVPVTAHLGVAAALLADCVILHIIARGPLEAPLAARLPTSAGAVAEVAA